MFLSCEEVAEYLGLSVQWVRKRIDEGGTALSVHIKCKNGRKAARQRDPSAVRISSRALAEYVVSSARDGWSDAEWDVREAEGRIWQWLRWYRQRRGGSTDKSRTTGGSAAMA